jgi:lipoate-protein ligase A
MTFHMLHFQNLPIFEQLQLEEALLRTDARNWVLINEGSPAAIVMGISGKKEELVDSAKAQEQAIPLIRRFSGGGTVVVDENTLFITFISQKELHPFLPYPEPILKWSEDLYKEVFAHPHFALRENDFVFGEKKFGGNALYIKKDRWLQHTSFLWDYNPKHMECLLHPKKTPHYRAGRSHNTFLCRLLEHYTDRSEILSPLRKALQKRFALIESSPAEALPQTLPFHRQATTFIR